MACNCDTSVDKMGGGSPGFPFPFGFDSRLPAAHGVRAHGNPVLGPTLGGGFAGSHIGSGVGRVGGGATPPVTWASSPDPVAGTYPQMRQTFRFDYSTPRRIFERPQIDNLSRETGGLEGGRAW